MGPVASTERLPARAAKSPTVFTENIPAYNLHPMAIVGESR